MGEVAGEGFIEEVEKADDDDPKDDLCGDTFLFDDFFVEAATGGSVEVGWVFAQGELLGASVGCKPSRHPTDRNGFGR